MSVEVLLLAPSGMTPVAAVEPVLRRWRNAVFVIFWLTGFLFASWATRVPNVRDILDASTSQMGLLIFGLAAGSVLGLFASSHVIARLGATTAILLCLSLASLGLVLVGLVSTFVPGLLILFVALMTLGVGYSITDVAMNLSGAANERQIGRTLMPVFHAMFSVGTMVGAGFGALLEHLGVPIGVHLVGVGLAAIVTTRIAVRFLQPAEHPGEEEPAEPARWSAGVRPDGRSDLRHPGPGGLARPARGLAGSADPADRLDRARHGVRRGFGQ